MHPLWCKLYRANSKYLRDITRLNESSGKVESSLRIPGRKPPFRTRNQGREKMHSWRGLSQRDKTRLAFPTTPEDRENPNSHLTQEIILIAIGNRPTTIWRWECWCHRFQPTVGSSMKCEDRSLCLERQILKKGKLLLWPRLWTSSQSLKYSKLIT